jgi:hypothetical protein
MARDTGRALTGALASFYTLGAYHVLVFSYLWRAAGVFILVFNTLMGLRDPAFQKGWAPPWASALLLLGVWLTGWLMALGATLVIRITTGRRPWTRPPPEPVG